MSWFQLLPEGELVSSSSPSLTRWGFRGTVCVLFFFFLFFGVGPFGNVDSPNSFDIHQTHPTHVTGILLLLRLVGWSLTGRSKHGKI